MQIKQQHVAPVQSLILFVNCLSFLADLIMSGSVFICSGEKFDSGIIDPFFLKYPGCRTIYR